MILDSSSPREGGELSDEACEFLNCEFLFLVVLGWDSLFPPRGKASSSRMACSLVKMCYLGPGDMNSFIEIPVDFLFDLQQLEFLPVLCYTPLVWLLVVFFPSVVILLWTQPETWVRSSSTRGSNLSETLPPSQKQLFLLGSDCPPPPDPLRREIHGQWNKPSIFYIIWN